MNTDDAIAALARISTSGTAQKTSPEELLALTRGGRRVRRFVSQSAGAEAPTQALMIGCGPTGSALLKAWSKNPAFSFTVISPSGAINAPGIVRRGHGAEDVRDESFQLLVLAVKAHELEDALRTYGPLLVPGALVLSTTPGVTCQALKRLGAGNAVRMAPNLAVSIGKGVTGLYAPRALNNRQEALLSDLLSSTGEVKRVDSEDQLDRLTAIAGNGPGYAFEIARCWVEAAESLGFDAADARRLVLKTLDGSVHLAMKQNKALRQLRKEAVNTNGAAAAGLAKLNPDERLENAFSATLHASYERAMELR